MTNEIICDKLVRLLIRDSIRKLSIKYLIEGDGNIRNDFLETSEKLANELFDDIKIIYEKYRDTKD